jgi:hypothetical protein
MILPEMLGDSGRQKLSMNTTGTPCSFAAIQTGTVTSAPVLMTNFGFSRATTPHACTNACSVAMGLRAGRVMKCTRSFFASDSVSGRWNVTKEWV